MQRYVIEKRDHHWVVSADGHELMYCQGRRIAVHTAKVADKHMRSEIAAEKEKPEIPQKEIH